MSKLAYLFPGQGSQFAGMGRSLFDGHPVARAVFDEADAVLGFALSKLCFEGPEDDLKRTENTQPAILTVSIAALRVLEDRGYPIPHYVAGHSLGEYSALVAAGALSFADAVKVVRNRGRYMQEAVPEGVGAMAALLRLPEGTLDGILAQASEGETVTAANLNSPDQVVIAGHKGAVERAMALAKSAGAKRAMALPVSAPFHSPLMKPAQERLAADLARLPFADLRVPLVNNCRAAIVTTGDDARLGLIDQVPNPVRWVDSVRLLAAQGVTRAIEIGPGQVLSGLVRAIEPSIECRRFGEAADWERCVA